MPDRARDRPAATRPGQGGGRPAAVVFDCDGVLVDSEGLAWQAWRDVLAGHGCAVTDDDVAALTGLRQPEVYAAFARRCDLPGQDELLAAVAAATLERFAGELRAFDDAVAAVRALGAAGLPLAVASSSPRERVTASLAAAGLDGCFHAVVAGDDVDRGKPDPEIYLRAAEALGADPAACVAVEDTPTGSASAKAAGMRVVAVRRGRVDPATLGGADAVVDRLDAEVLLAALPSPSASGSGAPALDAVDSPSGLEARPGRRDSRA